jgi:hypothetical protein
MTQADMETVRARSYEAGFSDGEDEPPSGTTAKFGYRRMTSGQLRDFSIMNHDDILGTVWSLWQVSPIAKRALTLKRDHLVGRSAKPTSDDEDITTLLAEFWQGNKMSARASEFALQLFLFGEQCYSVFVRQADGRVRLGYIDPRNIESVITHPDNGMENWAVVVKPQKDDSKKSWLRALGKRVYRIVREDEDYVIQSDGTKVMVKAAHPGQLVTHEQVQPQPWELAMLKAHGLSQYSGSCIYAGVNRMSNQSRGISDLVQVADWIDQADQTLFALGDREQTAGYFSFWCQLTGADESQVAARAKELRNRPPARGSVLVTNDSENWKMWAPDLKQTGSISTFIALLTLIMGGLGYPLAWYGYGDDTNRATLSEQATPSEKSLEHDQGVYKDLIMTMLRLSVDQAAIAANQKADEDLSYDIPLPESSHCSHGE